MSLLQFLSLKIVSPEQNFCWLKIVQVLRGIVYSFCSIFSFSSFCTKFSWKIKIEWKSAKSLNTFELSLDIVFSRNLQKLSRKKQKKLINSIFSELTFDVT